MFWRHKPNPVSLQTVYQDSLPTASLLHCRYQDPCFRAPLLLQPPSQPVPSLIKYWLRLLGLVQPQVILPQSLGLLSWNLLVLLALVFNFYQIPIALFFTWRVFESQFSEPVTIIANIAFVVVLLVNLLAVRPLTGYYSQGRLVDDRLLIVTQYIRRQFWLAMVSWLCLLLYIACRTHWLIYLKLLFYLSLPTAVKIHNLVVSRLELSPIANALYRLLSLITLLIMAVLVFAGIFFAIDYHYYIQGKYYPTNLWLTNSVCSQYQDGTYIDLVQTYPWYVWLNYAVYWTLQSVSMVGFGDITPRNPTEVLYCDMVLIAMTMLYAFFVSSIWEVLDELAPSDGHSRLVRQFQKDYGVTSTLGLKLGHYAYEAEQDSARVAAEEQICGHLSEQLRQELKVLKQAVYCKGVGFFSELSRIHNEYPKYARLLGQCTQQVRFGETETVLQSDDTCNKLYHVVLGQVQIHYANSRFKRVLGKDEFFNGKGFLCATPAAYSARTTKFTKICITSRQILGRSRHLTRIYQKSRELIENAQLYSVSKVTGEVCWVCNTDTHVLTQCPELFQWDQVLRADAVERGSRQDALRAIIKLRVSYSRKKVISSKYLPLIAPCNNIAKSGVVAGAEKIHRFCTYRPGGNL